jgi:DNA polymerase III subunit beta
MKFTITRETLLKPLQAIISVVEKKQTMPILSNLLVSVSEKTLELTATDLEIELIAKVDLEHAAEPGKLTIPAKKFFDIFKSLPEGASVDVKSETAEKILVKSGKSRFTLSGLPATDFPSMETQLGQITIQVPHKVLATLIRKTSFAMAQQDVRYFLNGMLLEVSEKTLRGVATDGHRLALASEEIEGHAGVNQVIVPRKTIMELLRILEPNDQNLTIIFGTHFIRIAMTDLILTSKLVDGRYPDYNRVIPTTGKNILLASKEALKQSLQRTAILSNEKYRGVRLSVANNVLKLVANNPEQEEAEDELEVAYVGQEIEVGFNISYLLDVMGALESENVKISLTNNVSSILLNEPENPKAVYVVMPIRL